MLKILRNHWKKIVIVCCILLIVSTPLAWKYRYHIKNLLVIRLSNSIELDTNETLLAVFSFKDLNQSQLVDNSIHYEIKLATSSKIPITRDDIKAYNDPSIPLLFTIETWGVNGYLSFKQDEMESLYNKKYDECIRAFCVSVIGDRPNVYFRLNPEIEVPSVTFPWQRQYYSYQRALEHLINLTKTHAPQIKHVFGGAGYPGILEYYPDHIAMDASSIVLSAESEKSLNYYPKYESVYYDLFRRLHRLRFLDTPIFIFGASEFDKQSFNQKLLDSIKNKVDAERAVVYAKSNFSTNQNRPKNYLVNSFEFGLYDPQNLLNNESEVTTEHLFIDFAQLESTVFEQNFKAVLNRNHNVIVSFEPWRDSKGSSDLNVLTGIVNHKYDDEIEKLYTIISQTSKTVYLRFAHEMEIPITRYAWQSQDPITYINAFRYVMSYKTELPSNIKRVWGPAGDRGSTEFWPGNDVVDVISIAIYGLPDKNITDPNKQLSFTSIFDIKKRRLRFLDKPIFITEFGVKGPDNYQYQWLEVAAKTLKNDAQVIGASYFNMADNPKAWGDIKAPDWSISKETLQHFTSTLSQE